jgi:hypothetical protein
MADKRDARSALRAYEEPSALQGAWDEIAGAFARYGRRSGAQRDASLAMLNQAVDPNTDPLTGAGMKALGLAGLVTHPLAFFPTGDEWRERTRNAGNTGRMGQAIAGALGDLPSLIDPHLVAGGAATVAPAIFAGMAAKTADLNKLRAAEKLETLGHSTSDIRDMTGWFRGADSQWRFEIPDNKAELLKTTKDLRIGGGDPVMDVLKHDELSKAYPMLDTYMVRGQQGRGGEIDLENRSIGLGSAADADAQRSTLLHELQHAVQDLEGFSQGSNQNFYRHGIEHDILPQDYLSKIDPWIKTQGPDAMAFQAYMKTAGEVEARNVQKRMNMTPEELADETNGPWFTQDYAYKDQIVRPSAPAKLKR